MKVSIYAIFYCYFIDIFLFSKAWNALDQFFLSNQFEVRKANKTCCLCLVLSIREAFIKKKKIVTFFTLGSDPPPYFAESVTKIKKNKKNKAFKVQF